MNHQEIYSRAMKTKYILSALLVILAAGFMSCSKESQPNGNITLEWWQFWTDPSISPTIEKMVLDYEKAHPNVKVNRTDLTWANGHEKIVVAFSSGTAPDIIELGSDWVPEFSSTGHLADITDSVVNDTARFYNWAPVIYNDRIYGFPWILGTRVLFINRDLMNRAKYGQKFVPTNWPQLKEVCYKIDSLGKDVYGFGSNAAEKHRLYKKFLPFFWSYDGRIISKNGKYCVFSSDKAYKALKFYKELSDSCSMVDTQRRLEDAFLDDKVGVVISGDWLLKRIRNEKPDFNFTTTLIPGPKFPGKSFAGGEYLAVNAKSDHKAAALDFIRFVTNAENQLLFCKANYSANPSNKETTKDPFFADDINLQTFVVQMNSSQSPPAIPQWVYVEDIIETALEDILFNGAPMAERLYKAKIEIEKLLKMR